MSKGFNTNVKVQGIATPVQGQKPALVPAAMDRVRNEISNCEEALECLVNKLDPVLLASPDTPQETEPEKTECILSLELCGFQNRLRRLYARITEITLATQL